MGERNTWIFHHSDGDGFASAVLIGERYATITGGKNGIPVKVSIPDNVHFEIADYNKPIDFKNKDIKEGDEIYILDYTPHAKEEFDAIDELWNNFGENIKFIIIDHHRTALRSIEECEGIRNYLQCWGCIFPTEDFHQAGCMLVYILQELGMIEYKNREFCLWYFDNNANFQDRVRGIFEYIEKEAPRWLRLTADHDIYSERLKESHIFNTGAFQEGLTKTYLDTEGNDSFLRYYSAYRHFESLIEISEGDKVTSYEALRKNNLDLMEEKTDILIQKGYTVKEITDRIHRSALRKGFEVEIVLDVTKDFIDPSNSLELSYDGQNMFHMEGKCFCAEGTGNSENFLDKFEEYDAVILFSFDGEYVKHSIFSKKSSDFRCNVLALWGNHQYEISGGGHQHAAGFYSKELLFRKNMKYGMNDAGFFSTSMD